MLLLIKTTVALNESFVFTIKISTGKGKLSDVRIQDLPNLEPFHRIGQWSNQESSINIINRSLSKSTSLLKNYRFQPKKMGKFKIPSLKVKVQGQVFQTKPILIAVTKRNPNPSSPSKGGSPTAPAPFSHPRSVFDVFPPTFSRDQQKPRVRLHLEVDKKVVYKTQRIRGQLVDIGKLFSTCQCSPHIKLPPLKAFGKRKSLLIKKKALSGTQVINGILYRQAPLDSLWLFPLQKGKLRVDSYSIQLRHFFSFPGQEDIRSFPTEDHSGLKLFLLKV